MYTMMLTILLTLTFWPQESKIVPCTVTEVVPEGVRSDCHGWKPAKDEKMYAPGEVNKQLRVGDTFYFVWKETRWVAEIRSPESITQGSRIVTCTVIEVDKSVACPEDGKMVLITFDGPEEAKQIFDEWRFVAPLRSGRVNTDAPLGIKEIIAGSKVLAELGEKKFRSIPGCDVTKWRKIKFWRQFREGERVPNTLFNAPCDYGKN